jgi:glycosyltransferase involved in cell wall biosynthesis
MKILFLTHGIGNGGVERVISILCNFLSKSYKITIISLNKENHTYRIRNSIKIITFPYYFGFFTRVFKKIFFIKKNIDEINPDLIISFSANVNIILLLTKLIFGFKNKVIISERTDPAKYPNSLLLKLMRNQLYLFTNGIVFQTPSAYDYFPKKIKEKSTIIYNPINPDLPKYHQYNNNYNRIIGVGSLSRQKNWHMLIKSFAIFCTSNPHFDLYIFGDGPLKEKLIKYSSNFSHTKGKIFFPGFSANIYSEMLKSSLFVSSSKYEGISNSMLEALALGLPSICTDCPVGGARLFIKNGYNGFLVKINDYSDLAIKMNKILTNKE